MAYAKKPSHATVPLKTIMQYADIYDLLYITQNAT
jgi:hypothetical protein